MRSAFFGGRGKSQQTTEEPKVRVPGNRGADARINRIETSVQSGTGLWAMKRPRPQPSLPHQLTPADYDRACERDAIE